MRVAMWTLRGLIGPDMVVVEGGAKGADKLANLWAKHAGLRYETFPADWKAHGKAAGPIRNQQMLEAGVDLCVHFPGGRGTADMVRRCNEAGVATIEAEQLVGLLSSVVVIVDSARGRRA